MKTALILYASMSGNTEDMARLIGQQLSEKGMGVIFEELDLFMTDELFKYDVILAGSYTWGDGDLPYEAEDFYEELGDLNLRGKLAACFGSGDHAYPKFCAAADLLQRRFKETGAEVFGDTLKIEGSPESDLEQEACRMFADAVAEWSAAAGKSIT
ncbi:flavodoxin [Metabacillus indicus]|uniref:flavodoxin n=1 Tax=Metabacillus indicus TaxID=246786 RepID=UPI003983E216